MSTLLHGLEDDIDRAAQALMRRQREHGSGTSAPLPHDVAWNDKHRRHFARARAPPVLLGHTEFAASEVKEPRRASQRPQSARDPHSQTMASAQLQHTRTTSFWQRPQSARGADGRVSAAAAQQNQIVAATLCDPTIQRRKVSG